MTEPITTAQATPAVAKKNKPKKEVKQIPFAKVYIQASYNNTIVTIADPNGNVLGWASAGSCGFKGPKKATPYAAGIIVKNAAEKVLQYGIKEAQVFIKGVGSGRESAIRALNGQGYSVISITDTTPIPHNGCRAPGRRRV